MLGSIGTLLGNSARVMRVGTSPVLFRYDMGNIVPAYTQPILDWTVFADGGAEVYTADVVDTQSYADHGLWTIGAAETYTVFDTGSEIDGGPYTDYQNGGGILLVPIQTELGYYTGLGGNIIPTIPRVENWNGAVQAVQALRPRLDISGPATQFDGIDDNLFLNAAIIPAATGWMRIYIYKCRQNQSSYRYLFGSPYTCAHSAITSSSPTSVRCFFRFSNDTNTGSISNVSPSWTQLAVSYSWNVLVVGGDNTTRLMSSNGGTRLLEEPLSVGALPPGYIGGVPANALSAVDIGLILTTRKLSKTEINTIVTNALAELGGTHNWTPLTP